MAKVAEQYQTGGRAWSPFRPDILTLLASEQVSTEPIYYGSNHTFLVTLDAGGEGRSLAVYKPAKGEYPLYDFPGGGLYRREYGTWLLSSLLGWDIVPPTVIARGRYGVGTLQLFIESDYADDLSMEDIRRIALLDLLVNNADRKGEHCLPGEHGRVWGIDHGLTFHEQPKLKTVLWHFAGSSLTKEDESTLRRARVLLEKRTDARAVELRELVNRSEWQALLERFDRLTHAGRFPNPRYKPVPYRW